MVKIIKIHETIPDINKKKIRADLMVSTSAELPTPVSIAGFYLLPGCQAQIIQASEPTFVTLDDDGTWYPEQS